MRGISELEFQARVQPVMRKVFQGQDEWQQLFQSEISFRRIIYPLEPYVASESFKFLLKGIAEAAAFVQDKGCYFSELHTYQRTFSHAYIELSELVDGFTKPLSNQDSIVMRLDIELSNYFMIYSERGKWGLFSSFEHFGLLGGVADFMQKIETKIPNIESQTYDFLREFRGDPLNKKGVLKSRQIIGGMLEHLYGSSQATMLLRKTGWY